MDGNPFRTYKKPWLKALFVGIYVGESNLFVGFLISGGALDGFRVHPQTRIPICAAIEVGFMKGTGIGTHVFVRLGPSCCASAKNSSEHW